MFCPFLWSMRETSKEKTLLLLPISSVFILLQRRHLHRCFPSGGVHSFSDAFLPLFSSFSGAEELGEPTRDPGACTSLGGASGGRARAHMGARTTRTRPPLTTPRNVPSAKNQTLTTW